jgi:WhiB family redox-sensing transcriptional regulator
LVDQEERHVKPLIPCQAPGVDPDDWFPTAAADLDDPGLAAWLCRGCADLDPCLDGALERRERDGIFGGTTPAQRRAIMRRSGIRLLPPHGTASGRAA